MWHDMPLAMRIKIIADTADTADRAQALKIIKAYSSQARYDYYYDTARVYQKAKEMATGANSSVRAAAVVLVRLTTLAQGHDITSLNARIFTSGGMYFIRYTTKSKQLRTMCIGENTLNALQRYAGRAKVPPDGPMFCYLDGSGRPLGSERLAKLALQVLCATGVDTDVFKSHSMRGAVATALMARGVDPKIVRHCSGWGSQASFQRHYAAQHQAVPYEDVLGKVMDSYLAHQVAQPEHRVGKLRNIVLGFSPSMTKTSIEKLTKEGD
eukprot:TRINITY_DN55326_c0_g1_i1.p1 TRINITY_DN55326_c0_g1~~TRINITY_DN55326_c0_g1_i1.p1  ORF type:complete len:268 (-),score=32.90 TRINITY_DN55326_c0_g1_i1:18-821(-)